MIALGILLIFVQFGLCWMICSQAPLDYLAVHWDTPSVLFVLLGILIHVFLFGKKKFLPGLCAVFRLPKEGDKEIAEYFWNLARFTLFLGVIGMIGGITASYYLISYPNVIGAFIALSIFTFSYAGWIAVMLFLPISLRFSIEPVELPKIEKRFPIGTTLLGIAAYFLTRALMAILLLTMLRNWNKNTLPIPSGDALFVFKQTLFTLNPADPIADPNYWHPMVFWDTPSMLLILMSVWAFHLAAGKVRNRMIWIPVCILFGIFWSLEGFTIMLCDLDPDKISAGCMVALLTALYGLLAAVFVFIGIGRYVLMFFSFLSLLIAAIVLPIAYWYACVAWFSGEEITLKDVSILNISSSIAFFIGVMVFRETVDYFKKRRKGNGTSEKNNREEQSIVHEEQAQQLLDSVVEKQRKGR